MRVGRRSEGKRRRDGREISGVGFSVSRVFRDIKGRFCHAAGCGSARPPSPKTRRGTQRGAHHAREPRHPRPALGRALVRAQRRCTFQTLPAHATLNSQHECSSSPPSPRSPPVQISFRSPTLSRGYRTKRGSLVELKAKYEKNKIQRKNIHGKATTKKVPKKKVLKKK